MKKQLLFLTLIHIVFSTCRKKRWNCDEEVSYKNEIQPLFNTYCNKCHSYDTYAEAKALADFGSLKDAVIDSRRMPPEGEKRLSSKERKKIFCWLEAGAPDN